MTEDFDMENLSQAIVLGASAIGAGLAMIAGLIALLLMFANPFISQL